jgi:hypothetical protein
LPFVIIEVSEKQIILEGTKQNENIKKTELPALILAMAVPFSGCSIIKTDIDYVTANAKKQK